MGRGLLILFLTLVMSSALIGDANAETQDLFLCKGEDFTLTCNCPGNDSYVSWTLVSGGNTSMVNGSDRVDLVVCNSTCTTCNYTLDNVTSANDGIYRCLVNGALENSTYNVTVATPPAEYPICSSSPNAMGTGNIYVRQGDNVTLECSMQGFNLPWSLGWSYLDNGTSISIDDVKLGMNPLLTSYVFEGVGEIELAERVFTCEAMTINMCRWKTRNCTVGPVYVITEENFYIRRANESIYVGDNVTLECGTDVTGTETRWVNMVVGAPLVFENVLVDVNGSSVFVCELFATSDASTTLDMRMTTIVVIDLQTAPTSPLTGPILSQSTSTESTDARTATPDKTTTVLPTSGSSPNVAAIAGGAAGGAVFLILIIVIIIVCCRSKRKSDVNGENVVHRPKKKTAKPGSKKHRSAILSLRHKLPLFSTPYDDSDDDDKVSHNAPVNTDVDTIIMEYRPKSKIASQIRVDLEADDGDEGTIENGFVPVNLGTANMEDESPYSTGIVEGRLGIMGPGTFTTAKTDPVNANQNQDDEADTETSEDMSNPYTKVYKANTPGDSSFDNMLYGPIKGVDDKAKSSMYDEESSPAKLPDSNETDIVGNVDTPNGNVDVGDDDVAKVVSRDTDITKDNPDTERESAAYAEIPPPIAID